MISECMNPACRRELHYLRDGRVVRIVQRAEAQVRVEHFWLCGDCHQVYDFMFSRDGDVSMAPKRKTVAAPKPSFVLTLVPQSRVA